MHYDASIKQLKMENDKMENAMIRKVDTKLKQCENKLKRKNEKLKKE